MNKVELYLRERACQGRWMSSSQSPQLVFKILMWGLAKLPEAVGFQKMWEWQEQGWVYQAGNHENLRDQIYRLRWQIETQ